MRGSFAKDIVGQRFERLLVIGRAENAKDGAAQWLVKCDCGTRKVVRGRSLCRGATRSCGCFRSELRSDSNLKHGYAHRNQETFEYRVWKGIKARCFNPKSTKYPWYGARGITMCFEWKEDFTMFLADMGKAPSEKHSIERLNNEGNYEPANCVWATTHEQAKNKRPRHDSKA